jgi:hypothetical protein
MRLGGALVLDVRHEELARLCKPRVAAAGGSFKGQNWDRGRVACPLSPPPPPHVGKAGCERAPGRRVGGARLPCSRASSRAPSAPLYPGRRGSRGRARAGLIVRGAPQSGRGRGKGRSRAADLGRAKKRGGGGPSSPSYTPPLTILRQRAPAAPPPGALFRAPARALQTASGRACRRHASLSRSCRPATEPARPPARAPRSQRGRGERGGGGGHACSPPTSLSSTPVVGRPSFCRRARRWPLDRASAQERKQEGAVGGPGGGPLGGPRRKRGAPRPAPPRPAKASALLAPQDPETKATRGGRRTDKHEPPPLSRASLCV